MLDWNNEMPEINLVSVLCLNFLEKHNNIACERRNDELIYIHRYQNVNWALPKGKTLLQWVNQLANERQQIDQMIKTFNSKQK